MIKKYIEMKAAEKWSVQKETIVDHAAVSEVLDDDGNVIAQSSTVGAGKSEEGGALEIPSGAVAIRIDTGQRVQGAPNTQPGGGM